jgi:hypothetical protein
MVFTAVKRVKPLKISKTQVNSHRRRIEGLFRVGTWTEISPGPRPAGDDDLDVVGGGPAARSIGVQLATPAAAHAAVNVINFSFFVTDSQIRLMFSSFGVIAPEKKSLEHSLFFVWEGSGPRSRTKRV